MMAALAGGYSLPHEENCRQAGGGQWEKDFSLLLLGKMSH